MQQNLAVEVLMELTEISLHAPRKQRVWYKLYRPWDQRGNARFQNFLEVPTVCGTDENKEDISYGAGRDHSFGMVANIH